MVMVRSDKMVKLSDKDARARLEKHAEEVAARNVFPHAIGSYVRWTGNPLAFGADPTSPVLVVGNLRGSATGQVAYFNADGMINMRVVGAPEVEAE